MHVPINVKSPNNASKWQMEFSSAFKGLKTLLYKLKQKMAPFLYIFLTVHLGIILVCNQTDAQFLLWYIYLNSLYVSSNYVLILRRTIA